MQGVAAHRSSLGVYSTASSRRTYSEHVRTLEAMSFRQSIRAWVLCQVLQPIVYLAMMIFIGHDFMLAVDIRLRAHRLIVPFSGVSGGQLEDPQFRSDDWDLSQRGSLIRQIL